MARPVKIESVLPEDFQFALSRLAGRQHGVVSRSQLFDLGLTARRIEGSCGRSSLLPVYRGVYAVGHRALRTEGHWMAAVLAGGATAVLSHRSAAALWRMREPCRPIEILRTIGAFSAGGLLTHRTRSLPEDQIFIKSGIPVTSPARTLVDLAGVSSQRALQDAYSASRRRGLIETGAVEQALELSPGRKGTGRLRQLEERFGRTSNETRSELETRFLALCLDVGLPRPLVNEPIGSRIVDFLWPREKLIIEVDGYAYHHNLFEEDRIRDLDHLSSGYETIRVTYRMIEGEPDRLVARIRSVLVARSPANNSGGRSDPD